MPTIEEHMRKMPCAQCGGAITFPATARRGEVGFMKALFCGERCATVYDPRALTVEKLHQTEHWLATPPQHASPERRAELERRNDLFPFPRIPRGALGRKLRARP